MSMNNLSNRTLLVHFALRAFTNKRMDDARTELSDSLSKRNAGGYMANLFPPTFHELQRVNYHCGRLRRTVVNNSLPWGTGIRIIQADKYFEFMDVYGAEVNQLNLAIERLCGKYDVFIAAAREYHGDYFQPFFYPRNAEELRSYWKPSVAFNSIPAVTEDFRAAVDPEIIDQVTASQAAVYEQVVSAWRDELQTLVREIHAKGPKDANVRSALRHARMMNAIVPNEDIAQLITSISECMRENEIVTSSRAHDRLSAIAAAWLSK